jgi:hypothetical protein
MAGRLVLEANVPPRRARSGWEDLERAGDSAPAGSKSSNSADSMNSGIELLSI